MELTYVYIEVIASEPKSCEESSKNSSADLPLFGWIAQHELVQCTRIGSVVLNDGIHDVLADSERRRRRG
jgi:hypothetical protein